MIIALFVTVYYVRANKAGAIPEGTTTRISGDRPNPSSVPGQGSRNSFNPGSIPDSAGNGNSAMSSGKQG
ncbi:hypothetical protein EFB08_18870 [Rufibacter latericius]|uniref:Uncharacterized protein n=1 Tax=Rufibacter latericius TaxID=2487040 RepID=A0A3M9MDF5_9BACT|nr:hypothetical protein EFB08_18870 [Rufibacter latericius]